MSIDILMFGLIICVRNTTDWRNSRLQDIAYPKTIWQNPNRDIEYAQSVWNSLTQKADYCGVRARLKNLSMSNWAEVHSLRMIVDITDMSVPNFLESLDCVFDSYLLLPTDDDDWFSPDVLKCLQGHLGSECIHWRGMCYDIVHRGKIRDYTSDRYPISNSYGITNIGMRLLKPADQERILRNHALFYEIWEEYGIKPKFVNECLSLYNLHSASIGYLMNCKIHPLCTRELPVLPSGLRWAESYLGRMNEIHNELVGRDAKIPLL